MTAAANAIPALSLPADLLADAWRVVVSRGDGSADDHLFSFPLKKCAADVQSWAAKKFPDAELVAVFPRDFESRNWVLLHAYHAGLPVQCDRLDFDFELSLDAVRTRLGGQFRGSYNLTLYPVDPTAKL